MPGVYINLYWRMLLVEEGYLTSKLLSTIHGAAEDGWLLVELLSWENNISQQNSTN